MLKRPELTLRVLCAALGALLLFQAARAVGHLTPLALASIPPLPRLATPTNTTAGVGTTKKPPQFVASQATNRSPSEGRTPSTNSPAPANPGKDATNSAAGQGIARIAASNTPPGAAATGMVPGPGVPPPGLGPGMPGMGQPPELPPAAQARVQRIIDSGILGMMMRPPPMVLLGIAGKDVLLRAPNGQTGLLQEGGELGGVKLLRIGTNRVLVEENGERRELSIFEGFGGASLLPK